ncbi:MAG: hypothetical protein Sapg2KO_12380 [Saprospiraceae bacterium]
MIKSRKHLLGLLKVDKEKLERILSKLDHYYYEKKEPKRDKKGNVRTDGNGNILYRVLYPSKGELKLLQARIKHRILDKFELPIYVQGGVKGRDNVTNALFHKGNKYFFLTDIKKFFPSIRHPQIYEMFVSNGFSPTIAGILTKLTTYKGKLPQGTPTSTALANLTFCIVDNKLSEFCHQHNLSFTRYVDDITISSKKCFKPLSQDIAEIITGYGYSISKKKTAYKIGPTDITGVSTHNNFLTTTRDFQNSLNDDISDKSLAGKFVYSKRVNVIGQKKRSQIFLQK